MRRVAKMARLAKKAEPAVGGGRHGATLPLLDSVAKAIAQCVARGIAKGIAQRFGKIRWSKKKNI
jgi:hypothetical protein